MMIPQTGDQTPDHAAPALALAVLLAAFAYALPCALFPPSHPWNGPVAPEILNLYCVTAWLGLAHFAYAYHGQGRALRRQPRLAPGYGALLLAGAAVLYAARQVLGPELFGALVWVYFIPHFLKAEVHFSRRPAAGGVPPRVLYWFPTLAFAFFTWALFYATRLPFFGWGLMAAAGAVIVLGAAGGIFRQMQDQALSSYALLAFFFIAEGLVWGNYSQYMTPQFRQGVYTFHIAIASFYHYLRAYLFAAPAVRDGKDAPPRPRRRYFIGAALASLAVLGAGVLALRTPQWPVTAALLDPAVFTFWVGLHLWASDAFHLMKKTAAPAAAAG